MKLPRDTDARELIKALQRIGYQVVRQSGSHIRLQTEQPKPHALTIPNHSPLKLGTLSAILNDVARHREMDKEELLRTCSGNSAP
ncbi:MAG TPA: type II toxin-antitoxin system HicA family toxin [Rhodanobacteraceae bacterium]|nr:type II toxin-antitoxin system HicA family toxin [Rhodanobacteraceae bacterium]